MVGPILPTATTIRCQISARRMYGFHNITVFTVFLIKYMGQKALRFHQQIS